MCQYYKLSPLIKMLHYVHNPDYNSIILAFKHLTNFWMDANPCAENMDLSGLDLQ